LRGGNLGARLHPDCKNEAYDERGMLPRDSKKLTENR